MYSACLFHLMVDALEKEIVAAYPFFCKSLFSSYLCLDLLPHLAYLFGLMLSASLHIMKVPPFGEIVKGGRDERDRI